MYGEEKHKEIYVTKSLMPSYESYIEMIKPLWKSHWLTNMGQYHQRLEEELKKYLRVNNISLMCNGHMSLEMIIQAMDFPEGSEIITTPFTFISTTHAIVRNKLIPVFCDIKLEDYTIDETKLEDLITKKTVAIMPVHVYGNICAIDKIQKIADKYNLKVIYDAAHAFGETYNGQGIGNYGDASVFSFHATKIFNTIEGGGVCYKDSCIGESLYNLKNFGIRGEESVISVGANAKMNEFQAIMGLCNLEIVDCEITERKKIALEYTNRLKDIKGIKLNEIDESKGKRNFAYFPIIIDKNTLGVSRDELYTKYRENDIFVRKYFYPLTCEQQCYENSFKQFYLPVAKQCADSVLTLPIYSELTEEDINRICDVILKY